MLHVLLFPSALVCFWVLLSHVGAMPLLLHLTFRLVLLQLHSILNSVLSTSSCGRTGFGQVAKLLGARAEMRMSCAFRTGKHWQRSCGRQSRERGLQVTVREQQGWRVKHGNGEDEMERHDIRMQQTFFMTLSRACMCTRMKMCGCAQCNREFAFDTERVYTSNFLFSDFSPLHKCCGPYKLVESGLTTHCPCQLKTGPVSLRQIHMSIVYTPLFASNLTIVRTKVFPMCRFSSSSTPMFPARTTFRIEMRSFTTLALLKIFCIFEFPCWSWMV